MLVRIVNALVTNWVPIGHLRLARPRGALTQTKLTNRVPVRSIQPTCRPAPLTEPIIRMAPNRLTHFPLCPHSRSIRLLLGELRLAYEERIEPPWLWRREFLALNPAGSLPVLELANHRVRMRVRRHGLDPERLPALDIDGPKPSFNRLIQSSLDLL